MRSEKWRVKELRALFFFHDKHIKLGSRPFWKAVAADMKSRNDGGCESQFRKLQKQGQETLEKWKNSLGAAERAELFRLDETEPLDREEVDSSNEDASASSLGEVMSLSSDSRFAQRLVEEVSANDDLSDIQSSGEKENAAIVLVERKQTKNGLRRARGNRDQDDHGSVSETFEKAFQMLRGEHVSLKRRLNERDEEVAKLEAELSRTSDALNERDEKMAELTREVQRRKEQLQTFYAEATPRTQKKKRKSRTVEQIPSLKRVKLPCSDEVEDAMDLEAGELNGEKSERIIAMDDVEASAETVWKLHLDPELPEPPRPFKMLDNLLAQNFGKALNSNDAALGADLLTFMGSMHGTFSRLLQTGSSLMKSSYPDCCFFSLQIAFQTTIFGSLYWILTAWDPNRTVPTFLILTR